MYIKLAANQFFDGQGFPLVSGRVSVFYYGSDTPADIYSLYHDEYVPVANPVTLSDEGRTASVWFEATKVTVKVEKYNNLTDSYELVCTYTDGFVVPTVTNDTVVYGMSGLADANPDLGSVNVVGYNSSSDCGLRTYVWDPTCTDTADGGCILESNSTQTGRWLLVSNLREMPSSYYGVTPSNDANLAALFGYPTQAGQWAIKFPPVVRMERGTYTTSGTIACSRPISFDPGAQFTNATIVCPAVEIAYNTSYVADFIGPDEVHSSWFRTVDGFWGSYAQKLVVDATNYFTSTTLTLSHTLSEVTIEGSSRIAMTYVNNAYLHFSDCTFNCTNMFSPSSDKIKFGNSMWYDKIWTSLTPSYFDFGMITAGHHTEFLSNAINNQSLSQFANTQVYVKMREAQIDANSSASKVLDMEGRTLSTFSSSKFTKLMNCRVTGNVDLSSTVTGFTMQDVVVEGYVSGGNSPVFIRVTAQLSGTEWTGDLTAYDSTLSGTVVRNAHNITVVGGRWRKSIDNATDNTTNTGIITFRGVELDGMNISFKTKNLNLVDCGIYQQTIEVYPMLETTTNTFMIQGRIENCEVNNSTPIRYKVFHDLDDNFGSCVWAYTWINNTFFGNDKGLEAEFWYAPEEYKWIWNTANHFVVYKGNSGLCPDEASMGTHQVSWSQCSFYPDGADAPSGGYYRATGTYAMPNWNGAISQLGTFGNWISPSYNMTGDGYTKGFAAAINPAPASYGYGDAFQSIIVRYGSAGANYITYV